MKFKFAPFSLIKLGLILGLLCSLALFFHLIPFTFLGKTKNLAEQERKNKEAISLRDQKPLPASRSSEELSNEIASKNRIPLSSQIGQPSSERSNSSEISIILRYPSIDLSVETLSSILPLSLAEIEKIAPSPESYLLELDPSLFAHLKDKNFNKIKELDPVEIKLNESSFLTVPHYLSNKEPYCFSQKEISFEQITHPHPIGRHLLFSNKPTINFQAEGKISARYNLPEPEVLELSDIFDTDIRILPKKEGGCFFSILFVPKVDLSRYQMRQHYYFLIDPYKSKERNAYQSFKKGVIRAIRSIEKGDSFNITILGKKTESLDSTTLPPNKKEIEKAELFLGRSYTPHRSKETIYQFLEENIPKETLEDEIHTAILISNGYSTENIEKERQEINKWLKARRGKINLYTAAVGERSSLTLLDLLGRMSGGSLICSNTYAGFPRKLAKLILNLKNPIANEVTSSATSSDKKANITLYAPSSSLFNRRNYLILGTADNFSDFFIVVHGKSKNKLINIKKLISLNNQKRDPLLVKERKEIELFYLYEKYLTEGEYSIWEEILKSYGNGATHSIW